MTARLTRWAGPPPDRQAVEATFRAEALAPHAWSNGPGDRLEVEAGTRHAASVGSDGVESLEAAR